MMVKLKGVRVMYFALIIIALFLVGCNSDDTINFPAATCAGDSETGIMGSNQWLCLKENNDGQTVKESCILSGSGLLREHENLIDTIESFWQELQGYMDQVADESISEAKAKSAVSKLADYFFPSDSCTTNYDYAISGFATGSDDWTSGSSGNDVDKLRAVIGENFPNMVYCNNGGVMDGKYVSQTIEDGETIKFHLYYCKDGTWYDLDEDLEEFDEDNDGSPYFSSDWVFDCDDNNPTIGIDTSIFTFSEEIPIEICGDKKDNLCVAIDQYGYDSSTSVYYERDSERELLSRYDELDEWIETYEEPWTLEETDNCDNNPTSCESNCLFKDNVCDYLTLTDIIDTSTDEDLDVETGTGYCCGADYTTDLGSTKDIDTGSYACLNQEFTAQTISEENDCPDGGDWCWIDAQTNKFKIFTLRELGEPAFDLVSDSTTWQVCSESEYAIEVSEDLTTTEGNRFYCLQEGDHYSFAECSDADAAERYNIDESGEASVKLRTSGDGTFALPLVAYSDDRYIADLTDLEGYSENFDDLYTIPDTLTQTVDFIGYDYLEFFVRYTNENIILPENIELIICGLPENEDSEEESCSEGTLYFKQNVLGYAVNDPLLLTNEWIHVKVPVTEWPDIASVIVQSFVVDNVIEVQNMYLSTEESYESGNGPLICSGEDSRKASSWLTDLDESDAETGIAGETICTKQYGDNAWLGAYENYEEVSSDQASCCGDDANEYYSEYSANDYGCFNGRPIANGATAMQVEFDVTYDTDNYSIEYPTAEVVLNEFNYRQIETGDYHGTTDLETGEHSYYYDEEDFDYLHRSGKVWDEQIEDLEEFEETIPIGYAAYVISETSYYYMETVDFQIGDGTSFTIGYEDSPKILATAIIELDNLLYDGGGTGEYVIDITNYLVSSGAEELYFFMPHNQEKKSDEITISYEEGLPSEFNIYIVAETNIIATETEEDIEQTNSFSYTCLSEECIYALPGLPPYEITNTNPELYDMYFIGENDPNTEILITSEGQDFNELGVIKVKSISQQILFDYEQDEQEGGFYGCMAASLINEEILLDNYNNCAVQGDYYCAHQDNNRLVNTWSTDSITEVGYAEVEEFDEDTVLELMSESYDATERNHSTAVVPMRNIVPNADFNEDNGQDVLYWQLLDGSSTLIENENAQVDNGMFTIASSYSLKSEKIAIKTYSEYSYTDSSDCEVSVYLIDKDGTSEYQAAPESIETGEASYIIIDVEGSCSYTEPMLQRIDDQGAGEYEFNSDFPERQGAACCPEDMCWNGYVCTNNMAEYTYMTEEPQENQTYRCIDGDWTYLEPQFDWNNEESGFCESSEQCFVTSSLSEGAEYGATAEDFYEGAYPFCVDDGEYILDHYCEVGEWTSRTKFLATKLLEFAEADDFVLYCAPFRDALPDYATDGYNYENYLAGEVSAEYETTGDLGEEISGESTSSETIEVCFDAIENSETGRRLVAQEDNTCINAVCVLQYKSSDTFEAAFATSMNHNITSDESFLIPLGISQSELDTYCTTEGEDSGEDFIQCEEELWYNNEINSLRQTALHRTFCFLFEHHSCNRCKRIINRFASSRGKRREIVSLELYNDPNSP